jgi:hypothetical protein
MVLELCPLGTQLKLALFVQEDIYLAVSQSFQLLSLRYRPNSDYRVRTRQRHRKNRRRAGFTGWLLVFRFKDK